MRRSTLFSALLSLLAGCASTQATAPAKVAADRFPPPVHAQGPAGNGKFTAADADIDGWSGRFENAEREVYARRAAIAAAMDLKPGQAVADVGAGTGALLDALVAAVGADGTVYATELSGPFRTHLATRATEAGWSSVQVLPSYLDRSGLPPASVDAALLVDVYHHLERPQAFIADLAAALKPGGRLHIVDFDPGAEDATDWVKGHAYLTAAQVREQVVGTGRFVALPDPDPKALGLTDNRMQSFELQVP